MNTPQPRLQGEPPCVFKRMGIVPRLIGVLLLPLIVVSMYLVILQWRYHGEGHHDISLVLLAAIAIGSLFIITSPVRLVYRLLWLILYIPAAWIVLFFYTVLFMGIVFHTTIG